MAIWNRDNQQYLDNNKTLYEAVKTVDQYGYPTGAHGMGSATEYTAFGETLIAPLTPVFQLDALYGLDPKKFETYISGSGSVDTNGPYMEASTGTSAFGYGVIRSRRAVRYRPGQGAVARFTAAFTTGVAGYTQRAGFFTQEQALQIGFDGEQFGILRQNGGKAHIQELTITSGTSGTESVTITLNGVDHVLSVPAGTIAQNAKYIGEQSFSGWITESGPTYVRFLSTAVGPNAGAFTSSVVTGTFAATMTTLQAGVVHTDDWTYQADFNLDTLDGNGVSGVILDPTKLNVYQIDFRWLGAGEIRFAIENPINGDMIFFHHIHYSNRYTTVHIDNPTLKLGYVAYSTGGTGTDVVVRGASMMGGIQGNIIFNEITNSYAATRTSGMNSGGTKYHLLSLHNRLIQNNKINSREIILSQISAGAVTSASTPVTLSIYFNQDIVNGHTHVPIDENWSSAYISTDATTIVATVPPAFTFILQPGSTETIDLRPLRIVIPPNNHITVGIRSDGVISNAAATLTWLED